MRVRALTGFSAPTTSCYRRKACSPKPKGCLSVPKAPLRLRRLGNCLKAGLFAQRGQRSEISRYHRNQRAAAKQRRLAFYRARKTNLSGDDLTFANFDFNRKRKESATMQFARFGSILNRVIEGQKKIPLSLSLSLWIANLFLALTLTGCDLAGGSSSGANKE